MRNKKLLSIFLAIAMVFVFAAFSNVNAATTYGCFQDTTSSISGDTTVWPLYLSKKNASVTVKLYYQNSKGNWVYHSTLTGKTGSTKAYTLSTQKNGKGTKYTLYKGSVKTKHKNETPNVKYKLVITGVSDAKNLYNGKSKFSKGQGTTWYYWGWGTKKNK